MSLALRLIENENISTLIFDIKTIHLFQLNKGWKRKEGKTANAVTPIVDTYTALVLYNIAIHIRRIGIHHIIIWHCAVHTKRMGVRKHKAKGAKVFN